MGHRTVLLYIVVLLAARCATAPVDEQCMDKETKEYCEFIQSSGYCDPEAFGRGDRQKSELALVVSASCMNTCGICK
uniref:ShKT domain-containing protein n=1 Tax=Plectus sambesii TaxID=2011161 RepID=A0A914WVF1_9BILA